MNFEILKSDQERKDKARTFETKEGQYIRHQASLIPDFLLANPEKNEEDWVEEGYSEIYTSVILDPDFSAHKRLLGNIENITFEDVKHYAIYSKLLDY